MANPSGAPDPAAATGHRAPSRSPRRETLGLSLAVLAMAAFWAWAGRWYGDEGSYLYCGKLAFEGQLPYRDFLYTQLPLVLYFYGAIAKFIAPSIFVARALSALITWGTAWLTIGLAHRLYGRSGALLTTLYFVTAWYPLFHLVIAKGYSGGALCLVGAVTLLLGRRGGMARAIATGVLFGLAALVRTSAGLLLALACLREAVVARRWRRAILIGLGGATTMAVFILPFVAIDFRNFWFGAFQFHRVSWFRDKTPLPDFLRYFTPYLVVALAAAGAALWGGGWRALARVFWRRPSTALLGALVVGMTAAHLLVGARAAEYHTLQMPLVMVLLAGVSRRAWQVARHRAPRAILTLTIAAAALVCPALWLSGTWLTGQWYPYPARELVGVVQQNCAPNEPVLALNPELFLLTGRHGFHGTEMGMFDLLYDYHEGNWRPAGRFSEEDFLDLIDRRTPRVVLLREGDLVKMNLVSRQRTKRTDFIQRIQLLLNRAYELKYVSPEVEGGVRRQSFQVWVRR